MDKIIITMICKGDYNDEFPEENKGFPRIWKLFNIWIGDNYYGEAEQCPDKKYKVWDKKINFIGEFTTRDKMKMAITKENKK